MQQGGTEPYSSEKASLQDCKVPADMGDTRRSRRASTKTEGKPPTELMVQGKDRADTGRTPFLNYRLGRGPEWLEDRGTRRDCYIVCHP